jgi:hypothetical protein
VLALFSPIWIGRLLRIHQETQALRQQLRGEPLDAPQRVEPEGAMAAT